MRDLRVPLLVGYGWLLAGWLTFGTLVPTKAEIQGDSDSVFALLDRLFDVLGSAGKVAAITLAAYLVGSALDEGLRLLFAAYMKHRATRSVPALTDGASEADKRSRSRLLDRRRRARHMRTMAVMRLDAYREDVRRFSGSKAEHLAPEFDVSARLLAESLLRLHLVPIFLALAAVLAFRDAGGLAAVAGGFAGAMVWHGLRHAAELRDNLEEIEFTLGHEYDQWSAANWEERRRQRAYG